MFTGFLHNSSQPDPSSRGWDHSHVPNLQRHRHPAQTATRRASQGHQTTTQLGSADMTERSLSVKSVQCPWHGAVTRPTTSGLPSWSSALTQDLGVVRSQAPPHCLAGRLSRHLHNWRRLTQDGWVLSVASGYRLELRGTPAQTNVPITSCPKHQISHMKEEISTLQAKGAITVVGDVSKKGFYSSMFLVPKKDGKLRPVINLRELNRFVKTAHFKIEGVQSVRDLLLGSDWLTRIDLKDAYFAVPIHTEHQQFLRFRWQGTSYQFICLPFGLSTATRVFTKLLKPVMSYLRGKELAV